MKGIVLAGGTGSRLYPITLGISKQLIPIYDVPMVYYPIATLIRAGIQEIAIISTPHDINNFKNLLGDGSELGLNFEYIIQPHPGGIAQCFLLAEDFIDKSSCTLILGDNIFYDPKLEQALKESFFAAENSTATIFAHQVKDPQRYGVIEFDSKDSILSIKEKPSIPKSKYAVTGLYVYPSSVAEFTRKLRPSRRGELEITDLNNIYLSNNKLACSKLSENAVWFDTGTIPSMNEASKYIMDHESELGYKLGCIEEASFRSGYMGSEKLQARSTFFEANAYGQYLKGLIS